MVECAKDVGKRSSVGCDSCDTCDNEISRDYLLSHLSQVYHFQDRHFCKFQKNAPPIKMRHKARKNAV
jgi:hypothetical protein